MKSKSNTVTVPALKVRNPVIAVLKTMKGGVHGPTYKAERRRFKQNIRNTINGTEQVPFPFVLATLQGPILRLSDRRG